MNLNNEKQLNHFENLETMKLGNFKQSITKSHNNMINHRMISYAYTIFERSLGAMQRSFIFYMYGSSNLKQSTLVQSGQLSIKKEKGSITCRNWTLKREMNHVSKKAISYV